MRGAEKLRNIRSKMKGISLTALSLPLLSFLFTVNAYAQAGVVFRMSCGEAGVVTARIGSRISYGEGYYYTDIYSSGLNVGANNLRGYPGASHFVVNDQGYSFAYFPGSVGSPNQTYNFSRYGKAYKCNPLR